MSIFGFSKQDITPGVGCFIYGYVDDSVADSIHDPLSVNAFYFEDKNEKGYMISAEVCSINSVFSEKMRRAICEKTGVPFENIILHGIHNHTGPNTDGNTGWGRLDTDYCENILLPQTLKACIEAKNTACEALMGIGAGESRIAVNRREQTLGNTITFGQCEWGSFDPRMVVFAFTDTEKRPVANLIYYTCHGTCAGNCTEISRDFAGGMIDMLSLHSGAPSAFFCGPEGDAGPRLDNKQTVGTIKDAEIMGERAGRDAVKIYDKINEYEGFTVNFSFKELKIPLKNRISEEEALKKYELFKNFTVNLEGQTRDYCLRVLDSYKTDYEEKKYHSVFQTAVKIGNNLFLSYPYELFSDIALRINKAIAGTEVFCLSNANGSEGYFPCHSEISKGGYEIEMFLTHNIQPYCDNADFELIKETLKHTEDILCTE